MQRARVVHRLIRHAGAHRPVADHRDHVARIPRLALQIARHRHAEPGRDRGRAVRRPERVVFALRPAGEARQPAALAQRADAVAPAGQDLVRIGLVPDVPDQPVVRRVEHRVQRDRQLHHPERRRRDGRPSPRPRRSPRRRNSSATCRSCSAEKLRKSAGMRTRSSRGVSHSAHALRRSLELRSVALPMAARTQTPCICTNSQGQGLFPPDSGPGRTDHVAEKPR